MYKLISNDNLEKLGKIFNTQGNIMLNRKLIIIKINKK
jgi:hypothetical protein